ncbi:lambda family phage tail tape measure protein [Variovorax boronicumulans]|uniref:Lambda family phage tail tape measure protein n=1 Tax=Variovorax boronicumulans TaxID=436515 RepID=A0AAW8CQJ5_9BURK|nr:phage tail tape measure protein [Variovorax boronicumulans]MDP9891227.1 lambda family phage tail tape measure protein [Variovorax boronicumulans]MDQ0051295.1 lambda family phage tail tape measure protein [Variovorax boronicumulans]
MATVGRDQLVIDADVSGVKAGVAEGKKSIASMAAAAASSGAEASKGIQQIGEGGKESAKKVDVATRNIVSSIQRQIAVTEAGAKSSSDFYRVLAGQRGVDVTALKPYLDQLDAVKAKQKAAEDALRATSPVMQDVGMSARATAAAMRGVPAQFTDIVTSLQGGQAPLTVLLQQGGQLKDMFGGVGPAARALGTYITGLINPFTLAAAAAAVLGLAYYQVTQRQTEFSKSLIISGNYAGASVGQLDELARSAGGVVKSQSLATDAVNELARSGKVTGDVLGTVATGVAAFSKLTGESVSKAVDTFISLSDEPTKAAAKLNESLHFLDLATFQRIRSLEEQGLKEQAAGVAQEALARESISRMQSVGAQAGTLSRILSGVAGVATGMWQTLANGVGSIGVARTPDSDLKEAKRIADFLKTNGGSAAAIAKNQSDIAEASRRVLNEQNAAFAEGQRATDNASKIAADQRVQALLKSNRSQAQVRKDERQSFERDAKLTGLSAEKLAAGLAAIDEKHKDPKGPAAKAFRDDAGTKMLETLRQQGAALQDQLSSTGKMTDAEREQAKFAQLIADLKGKTLLTAEQKSLVASQDKIRAQLEINAATEREIGFQKILLDDSKRRSEALKATENAADGVRRSLADMASQQGEQYNDRLSVMGLGSEAAEQQRSREQIERQYSRTLRTFTEEAARNKTLESDAYKKATEDIRIALQGALAANGDYYAAIKEKQSDWKLGASEAFANYGDDAANSFKNAGQAATRAFGGAEDALTSLVTKGKKGVKGLMDSIAADLARAAIRQGVTGPAASYLAGLLGGGSSLDRLLSSNNAFGTGGGGGFNWGSIFSSVAGMFKFDGGGYTGSGPRSGGLDGKGGFMAMMHPRETVVDHTKGQSAGGLGGMVIVNQTTGRIDNAQVQQMPDGRQQLTLREVAAAFDDPNSVVSKGFRRNYRSERRRS